MLLHSLFTVNSEDMVFHLNTSPFEKLNAWFAHPRVVPAQTSPLARRLASTTSNNTFQPSGVPDMQ